MLLFIASVTIALTASALCSLLEATLLSLTPTQVANLSSRQPRLGKIWQNFKARIDRPIAVILIINTAAHTIGATLAGAQFEVHFGHEGVIWFSLVFTYFMLQFTEILPKTLGVRYNAQMARLMAYPLSFFIRLFTPIVYLIHLVNRPFEPKRDPEQPLTSLEDISTLAGLARLTNLINPQQERIIQEATKLSEKQIFEVMIPADQVTFLSTKQSLADAIVTAHLDPHTRFPICEGDDRNLVLGYVNFKEMIYVARDSAATGLRNIIRPVHFALPDQSATELLKIFVERHEHMAIVRGPEGDVIGLVTLEDLIEELVGELEDEFDRLPRMLHRLGGGAWRAGGGVPIAELAKKLELTLPDAVGTTSAWLIRRLGRVPKPNEVHRTNGTEFLIRRTRRGKVFEVAVTRSE